MAGIWDELHVGSLFHPLDPSVIGSQDYAEALDANYEDANGLLPHESGYAWDAIADVVPVVPELIPDWVVADARELRAGGMTLRKIATAILPVTECDDIPSCEQLLARRLEVEG